MSPQRLIQTYHFQVYLTWWDGPTKILHSNVDDGLNIFMPGTSVHLHS